MRLVIATGLFLTGLLLSGSSDVQAQAPAAPETAVSPQTSALVDLTGYWVSIVNEDWRWRMVTAPRGDFPGIPLNPAGREASLAWDPETDGSCLAFGAAGLLRMPTRVRISWDDNATLKLETDNGIQTRLLHFVPSVSPDTRSLQGYSTARWRQSLPASNAFGISAPEDFVEILNGRSAGAGGGLDVVTTNLHSAWLRRNGVTYSEDAILTEHFDRFPGPDGSEWLIVTMIVEDPTYLMTRFVTSSQFRQESDGSNWNPTPCRAP